MQIDEFKIRYLTDVKGKNKNDIITKTYADNSYYIGQI